MTAKQFPPSPQSQARAIKQEAKDRGESTYLTGFPCPRGHISPRYVKSGGCIECCKTAPPAEGTKRIKWFMLRSARSRAKALGLSFEITLQDVLDVWPSDNRCPIFGTELKIRSPKKPSPESASLDRVRPEQGYVKGNIAVISSRANRLKNDCADPAIFRRLADWIENKIP